MSEIALSLTRIKDSLLRREQSLAEQVGKFPAVEGATVRAGMLVYAGHRWHCPDPRISAFG
ncbi:hypothetical protein CHELA40_30061 [Chelatococcus asaccharovorans]|nr:hypothetical protein CHELA17_40356 [Chelatococcus asaccharovorans]CAH1687724.1 hypothetical protein CHELA40_30061 [Chelatococcus asaccharovorans]